MNKYNTVIGMDLGDKHHYYCALDAASGEVVNEGRVLCTKTALQRLFSSMQPTLVAIETGTHSPWVSRLLTELGHEVLVGNARKLRAIYTDKQKSDQRDAEMLARMARMDPKLLSPIRHRGKQAQADLAVLRSRDTAVSARSKLINHVRGSVKSYGQRLPACSAPYFHKKVADAIPEELRPALAPLLDLLEILTKTIHDYNKAIDRCCQDQYPETELLRSVPGVGPITALCFVLTLEEPHRFKKSRSVPAFFGLTPARSQSGNADPQLRISKQGDATMRRLLVSCAQYILGPFGPDSALRQWGLQLAEGGSSRAKRRAVVAVARKLAVLLHRMWADGTYYEAFPNADAERPTHTSETEAAA